MDKTLDIREEDIITFGSIELIRLNLTPPFNLAKLNHARDLLDQLIRLLEKEKVVTTPHD